MYAREIDGTVYTFGVTGKLLRNNLVMFDHQTNSEWSQLLGEALTGPLTGTRLRHMPTSLMTWQEWREQYPNTLALKKPARRVLDPYVLYYNSDRAGVFGETVKDDRLPTKALVIGMIIDRTPIAYSYESLLQEKIINDRVNDKQLLVVINMDSYSVAVFDRTVDDQTLTFAPVGGGGYEIKDKETGTLWNALTGRAVEGPLLNKSLDKLPFTPAFWFGWKDNYPDTLVHGERR